MITKVQIRARLELDFADLTTDDIITHLISHFTCTDLAEFHNEISNTVTIDTNEEDE